MPQVIRSAIVVIAVAIVMLVFGPSLAAAQDTPPVAAPERQGFVIGFSLGLSHFICTGCETNLKPEIGFRAGWMATPRLALLLDGVSGNFWDGGINYGHNLGTVAVQYFVSESVWVKAGIGEAELVPADGSGTLSLVWQAGIGTELRRRGRSALDLSAGFTTARRPGQPINSLSARLGFNWY